MAEVSMENPLSMKRRILVLIVVFVSGMQMACHQPSHQEPSQHELSHQEPSRGAGQSRVVLPNAELLHCRFGECAQMWSPADAKPGTITPWRVTIERLGSDPCPNGIVALYDKNASLEELASAVTERYGSPLLKGDMGGGTWKDASKNLVIDVYPLADESSPEAQPVPDAMKGDPVTYFFTSDAFHNIVDRSVPRKELKELIFLAMFNTSCGVRVDKPK